MRADEAITDSIETITLRLGQICHSQLADSRWLFAEKPEIRAEYLLDTARIAVHAMVRYAEQPCKPVTYPADWWQAVKQHFAPAWALKRWPVELTIWEPVVIYPEIKLPREKNFIKIHKLDHLPTWQP